MDLSIRIITGEMLAGLGRCKALDLSILVVFLHNPDATIEEHTSQSFSNHLGHHSVQFPLQVLVGLDMYEVYGRCCMTPDCCFGCVCSGYKAIGTMILMGVNTA